MANDLKNRIRICTTLSKETNAILKDYSNQSMIPISKIIESAILEYIKRAATHKA